MMRIQQAFRLLLASMSVISVGLAGSSQQAYTSTQISQAETLEKPSQQHTEPQTPLRRPDVIYVPTPHDVVDQMLAIANVTKDDVVYDLGSGDGRIPIRAAKKYGARSVGIDINPRRIQEAKENARKAGVAERVEFRNQDLFTSDFSEATVVTLYLLPGLNRKLRPELFRQLKPGTRIVSYQFDMGDWQPQRVVQTREESTIFYWVIPKEIPGNLQ
jgi:SAM-dependent methyltransferase